MASKFKIGILTGGGDVPGLNVAIRAVVNRAQENNIEVIGLRRGWMSVLRINPDDPESISKYSCALTPETVRTIDRTGGTILHTSRTNPSNVKPADVPEHVRTKDRVSKPSGTIDCTKHTLRVLEVLGLEAIIPIGGDDTLSFASRLQKEGFRTVAIPKTMDNDVFGTDYCIGFSTAVTRSVDAITRFRTSVGSHERLGIVELFGRNSGETSLFAAYLSNVDRAIISEVPFDMDKLCKFLIADRNSSPSHYAIMTISEGATETGGDIHETGEVDAYGHKKLGGIGKHTAGDPLAAHGLLLLLIGVQEVGSDRLAG